MGFVVTTDWLPARLELGDPHGRHVDLHPIFDDGHGGWWQHGLDGAVFEHPSTVLTAGTIGGLAVSCLTPARQLELHSGYEPRKHDLLDLAVIAGLVDRQ